jgi:hypothetical protein
VTLSMVMSHDLLDGLFTGVETAGRTVDGDVFMRGFHLVFVFSAATSVIAIICSSLRGSEQGPGGRVVLTDAAEEALLARGTAAIQPTGRAS